MKILIEILLLNLLFFVNIQQNQNYQKVKKFHLPNTDFYINIKSEKSEIGGINCSPSKSLVKTNYMDKYNAIITINRSIFFKNNINLKIIILPSDKCIYKNFTIVIPKATIIDSNKQSKSIIADFEKREIGINLLSPLEKAIFNKYDSILFKWKFNNKNCLKKDSILRIYESKNKKINKSISLKGNKHTIYANKLPVDSRNNSNQISYSWYVMLDKNISSAVYNFYVKKNHPPQKFNSLNSNNKYNFYENIELSWSKANDSDNNNINYLIYYKINNKSKYFLNSALSTRYSTSCIEIDPSIKKQTQDTVFWWVGATDGIDTTWSDTANFIIYRENSPPDQPVFISRFKGCQQEKDINGKRIPWQPSSDADNDSITYSIQFSKDYKFKELLYDSSGIKDTYFTLNADRFLRGKFSGKYFIYYRIMASDGDTTVASDTQKLCLYHFGRFPIKYEVNFFSGAFLYDRLYTQSQLVNLVKLGWKKYPNHLIYLGVNAGAYFYLINRIDKFKITRKNINLHFEGLELEPKIGVIPFSYKSIKSNLFLSFPLSYFVSKHSALASKTFFDSKVNFELRYKRISLGGYYGYVFNRLAYQVTFKFHPWKQIWVGLGYLKSTDK